MTAVTPRPRPGLVAVGTATSEGAGGPDRVAAWYSADGQAWAAGVRATARRTGA